MDFQKLRESMWEQLKTKELLEQAKTCAYEYINQVPNSDVYPSQKALAELAKFDQPLQEGPSSPAEILQLLNQVGSKCTVMQSGGKYFGFVNGGILPIAGAAKWITDVWDQNSALYVMSPVASKLEEICEKWIVDLLGLPHGTAAGFVSGSSTALICALAAARNDLLLKQNWDVSRDGLFGAPEIRVVIGEQAHSSVLKALSLIGLGKDRVVSAPIDNQGRIDPGRLPPLDSNTLFILQAGNVNSGAFDPFDELCDAAQKAGAWVHVDGAFGLWAAASPDKYRLIRGFEKADSWSVDTHKTLNAPYDCGIVLCKNRAALVSSMQANGSYLLYSESRDGMLYTPEMSRRARGVELWAALKYLGKSGVGDLVAELCRNAKYFAAELSNRGFEILNDVVFNQVLVKCASTEKTLATLKNIQASGKCWCGGATWNGEPVIRISVCSWQTTKEDIDACVEVFSDSRAQAAKSVH